ncbi:MAG TPA: GNAT family N-acetyltransferase [Thermoguttaceae bacterium]|nr:GNAT family N-acetyltransferase [Thermoguttaceae bacterium]HUU97603.1 GNAT family N-acetyltransferase [Phycisphaerae bacterium]
MLLDAYPKEATLRDGRRVVIHPLANGDFDKLYAFFQALPPEDRLFLRNDVTDPAVVQTWVANIDLNRAIPLVAEDGEKIVADGTLHFARHGWSQHVGNVRLVTAATHRQVGLGTIITRELVALAEERGLEKLQTQVIEDNVGSVALFKLLGFKTAGVLKDMVRDREGKKRNLAIMVNDVADLGQIMEDWIHDSMIPGFRAGEGA